jgi:hypothetical protein
MPLCKACPYEQELDFDYFFLCMHFPYTLIIFSSLSFSFSAWNLSHEYENPLLHL